MWKRVTLSITKPEVVYSRRGRHLEIVYDVITPTRVARFRRNLGTWFKITGKCCYQRKEELQYVGRLFFPTGSSYISAVDKDTSTKFSLRIDFDLRIRVTSSNTKPEIVWSRRDRHLENEYDVFTHYSAADEPIWTKFGSLMQSSTPITAMWSKSQPEEFQYSGRLFFSNCK